MGFASLAWTDLVALAFYLAAWAGYAAAVDRGPHAQRTLSASMDRQRRRWVREMLGREVRIPDTAILAGLQNGTAFFASASMLAIGACLALLTAGSSVAAVVSDIVPFRTTADPAFEVKTFGLTVVFVYAFFKFGWSYRIFNYASILVGALPPAAERDTPDGRAAAERAAVFIRLGGRHFNRGQRAFNFSIPFLGWYAGPWVMVGGTILTVAVLLHRQFWSESARIVAGADLPGDSAQT